MTNPMQALMRGGPAPGGAPSTPPGASPAGGSGGSGSAMLRQLFAGQQGADPQYTLKQLSTMRQSIAEMIPLAMTSVEGLATDLAAMLKVFDKAIDRTKKASMGSMLARPPIGFQAAQSSNAMGGGGGMGGMPSGGMGVGGGVGGGP